MALLGVGAGLGGKLHKLCFLLGRQVHFHALKIRENPCEGDILGDAEHHPDLLRRASLLPRRSYDRVVAYL